MPATTTHKIIWSTTSQQYIFQPDTNWSTWLNNCTSFSFEGQHGPLTVLKETRSRGSGYWYAYRRHANHVHKTYLGPTKKITLDLLESAAYKLNPSTPSTHPVLLSKLQLPRQHASSLPRPSLFALLDHALSQRLSLISAPAGYGKTTLISSWATHYNTQQGRQAVAWLSLDPSDNDPLRFCTYVILALQSINPTLGKTSLALLNTPNKSPEHALEAVLAHWLNELNQLSTQHVLVLEDYHLITTPRIHQTLSRFMDYLPPSLHLMIITRHDPPLPLARWRARKELCELQASDLLFSPVDTHTLLAQSLPFQPSTSIIEHITTNTEGWAVGIQLAILALRNHSASTAEQAIQQFTGGHRSLRTYLIEEVLHAQPEDIQLFLLQTSFLQRFTPALCAAITGRTDSQRILTSLENSNLFLLALDTTEPWYRYHHLFAQALQYEAQSILPPNTLKTLYHKASLWHEQAKLTTQAIEYSLLAQDFIRAANLIEYHTTAQTIEEVYGLFTMRRWLEQLPDEVLHTKPMLCFTYAVTLLFTLNRYAPSTKEKLEPLLQQAECIWRNEYNTQQLGKLLAFRSLVSLWQGNSETSLTYAQQAFPYLPTNDLQARGNCLLQIGVGQLHAGQISMAHSHLMQSRPLLETVNDLHPLLANLYSLGEVYFHQGELSQATYFYQQVEQTAQAKWGTLFDEGSKALDDQGHILLGQATLAYEWNNLALTEELATQVIHIGQQLHNETLHVPASLLYARILHLRDPHQAQQILLQLVAQIQKTHLLQDVLLEQARQTFYNDQDNLDVWLTRHSSLQYTTPDLRHPQQEQANLLYARALIQLAHYPQTLTLLSHWHQDATTHGRIRSLITIHTLFALLYFAQNDLPQTIHALQQALQLAQPENHQRIFLDEGTPFQLLLHSILPHLTNTSLIPYAQTLLITPTSTSSSIPSTLSTHPTHTLSPQELRVLRLLVSGHSKPEIANELIVSINTIKTQVNSIYRKLRVSSRKEAYAKAQLLHLL